MNDRYKFRAWDKVRKEYLSGGNIFISIEKGERPEKSCIYLDTIKDADMYRDRFIIEQYTGLKDKNGVEIYGGDIVKWGHIEGSEESPLRIARVEINPDIQFHSNVGVFWFGCFAYRNTEHCLEVIGSIHDNHDLLEVGE